MGLMNEFLNIVQLSRLMTLELYLFTVPYFQKGKKRSAKDLAEPFGLLPTTLQNLAL